jgi:hypothetical protein
MKITGAQRACRVLPGRGKRGAPVKNSWETFTQGSDGPSRTGQQRTVATAGLPNVGLAIDAIPLGLSKRRAPSAGPTCGIFIAYKCNAD